MKHPPWKVGELAKRLNLSKSGVFSRVGSLESLQGEPSLRTASGHRLYDTADIQRLQQIQSLRLMGLSLDEVKRLLDGAAVSPRQVIDLHLARLHEQMAAHARLAERLTALALHLDQAGSGSIDDLCHIIEAMTTMEKYFTTEQLEVLRERRTGISEQRAKEVQDAWAEIIPAIQKAMDDNLDPTSPEILAIARRWRDLVNEFTGGDPAIKQAVMSMYEHEAEALKKQNFPMPTPAMFGYIGRALQKQDAR